MNLPPFAPILVALAQPTAAQAAAGVHAACAGTIASVLCALLFAPESEAATTQHKRTLSTRQQGLVIRVEGEGWGSARNTEIESVLYSAADELLTHVPEKLTMPIVVTHSEPHPTALYEKGPEGEYLVRLSAKNRRWAQFAYQFAHELCHIMSNYEESVGADTTKYNQWFEEALCEAASLYTLRSMAESWRALGPASEWSGYASALHDYAEQLIGEGHRQLPPRTALAAWLRQNERQLRNDPYLREKNEVIANVLLPLFERNPDAWDALRYLNLDPEDARGSLRRYLRSWHAYAPQEHRSFITEVLALFEPPDVATTVLANAGEDTRVPGDFSHEAANSQAGPAGPAPSPPDQAADARTRGGRSTRSALSDRFARLHP